MEEGEEQDINDELQEIHASLSFLMGKLVEISHHLMLINIALHKAGIDVGTPRVTIQ